MNKLQLTFLILFSALTGMLLAFSYSLFGFSQYGVRMACEVESQMTSVERVMAYSELPPEPGYNRHVKPPEDWPSRGVVNLHNVSMTYMDDGPRVLKNVNLNVNSKENVGIVGRTGAGKSSIVAALLRMPDPKGQVLIDGVDLGTIDIQAARRSMAVITQDPVLFAGSVKKNLDPFERFSDLEIWRSLEGVQLKDKLNKLDKQLDFCVGEGGSGFSVGERQLLCLARALLQNCKIIILDEATANVDYKTDQIIQQVIRDKFANSTVLTIAHRLNTIMDYDKIVVLDQGHVVEYDCPNILEMKENGFFNRLLKGSQLSV